MVIIALDFDQGCSVNLGGDDFFVFEVGGNEDEGLEASGGGLRSYGIRRLPVDEQPTVSNPNSRALLSATAATRSLKESVG